MKANDPIGFFDSGLGGLAVLKHAREVMPEENYIFFGDSANAPYGTKTEQEVMKHTQDAVDILLKRNIKALVIACNTATSVAVEYLRSVLDIPVISMEPAVKPALEKTDGKVLLLATNVTLSSKRVAHLLERYDFDNRVLKVPAVRLAEEVENAAFTKNSSELNEYLTKLLFSYSCCANAVVLGCTHYAFVEEKIKSILGNALVFDGIDGTVNHLRDILIAQNIKKNDGQTGETELLSSKTGAETVYRYLLLGGKL